MRISDWSSDVFSSDLSAPRTGNLSALTDLALLADDRAQPLELPGHELVQFDDLVEGSGDLAVHAGLVLRQAHRKIAAAECAQVSEQAPGLEVLVLGVGLHAVPLPFHGLALLRLALHCLLAPTILFGSI